MVSESQEDVDLRSIVTLVLWTFCLAVGVLGLAVPVWRAGPPAPPPRTMSVDVELASLPPPQEEEAQPAPAAAQPQDASAQPAGPPSLPVAAAPSAAIAFAQPLEGPVRLVAPAAAAPVASAPLKPGTRATRTGGPSGAAGTGPATHAAAAPVQQLTFGEGEGAQPPPEYPRAAILAREQGVVMVRFTVGADGRVISAQAVPPYAGLLITQAALRVIRQEWRMRPGTVRTYEIPVEFQLNEH